MHDTLLDQQNLIYISNCYDTNGIVENVKFIKL